MKLIDYINAPNHPKNIVSLDYYQSINFKCEEHGVNLHIRDGFEQTSLQLTYYIDEFLEKNPHFVRFEDHFGEPQSDSDVKKKIIYCKQCRENIEQRNEDAEQEHLKSLKPKKLKGRKSQKYNNEK
jgi:hypothetical protein